MSTIIVNPLPAVIVEADSSPGSGLDNLLTPNPREAFVSGAGGAVTVALDLQALQLVDTFLLGYSTVAEGADFRVLGGQTGGALLWEGKAAHSYRRTPMRHALAVLPQPVNHRYIRLQLGAAGGPAMTIGVVAVGLSIRPGSGREYGWGRPIADTSRIERLQSGGFGIDRGVATGGLAWTMPALSDEERERLYALQLDVGIGGTVLIAEDAEQTAALNERIHWGLLTRLETFDRNAPAEAKWPMQVQDWG